MLGQRVLVAGPDDRFIGGLPLQRLPAGRAVVFPDSPGELVLQADIGIDLPLVGVETRFTPIAAFTHHRLAGGHDHLSDTVSPGVCGQYFIEQGRGDRIDGEEGGKVREVILIGGQMVNRIDIR
jgi:hypothetical protein